MPLYEYHCPACDTTFEKFLRSFASQEEIECPECESKEVDKAFSTFATRGTADRGPAAATNCAPGGKG